MCVKQLKTMCHLETSVKHIKRVVTLKNMSNMFQVRLSNKYQVGMCCDNIYRDDICLTNVWQCVNLFFWQNLSSRHVFDKCVTDICQMFDKCSWHISRVDKCVWHVCVKRLVKTLLNLSSWHVFEKMLTTLIELTCVWQCFTCVWQWLDRSIEFTCAWQMFHKYVTNIWQS
jgi:hypothetical protein